MIEILYATEREKISATVELSGTWKDFEILRKDLLSFLESNEVSLFAETDKNVNSKGWDFVLEILEIDQTGDTVEISVSENKILKIKGSQENLKIFADWLEFNEETASGYHAHYEYFEGNDYVNSKSVPLIIEVK